MVFNPARVRPLRAYWLHHHSEFPNKQLGMSEPIPSDQLAEISAAAQADEEEDGQEE
jgi:hypothetical protein